VLPSGSAALAGSKEETASQLLLLLVATCWRPHSLWHAELCKRVVCRFVQECAKRGLLVMLDMHRLVAANEIPELW
jgi:hypothetical protein